MILAWFDKPDTFGGAGTGRESAANPQRAFIQVRKELGADHSADGQIDRKRQTSNTSRDSQKPHADRNSQGPPVQRRHPGHHRVVPFARALREEEAREHGRNKDRKQQAPNSANATVHAMGLNKRPSTRCSVKIGR